MMKHRLSMKLLFYIVLCSSSFTLLVTAFQLYMDYRRDLAAIHESIQFIESSYLQALAASAWDMDENQIRLQLQGALKLQDVKYLEIVEQRGAGEVFIAAIGDPKSKKDIFREFSLKYPKAPEGELLTATLRVTASLEGVYQRLFSRALVILASNAVKMFLASFCIFLIIQFLITRHITKMARYTKKLEPDKLDKELVLDRKADKSSKPDELYELATSFNDMRVRLNNDIEERSRAEKALRQSEERYRRLVETMTDIVFTLNTEGLFTFLNPEFENLTGYPVRDLIGHPLTEVLAPEYIESTVDRFKRGLSGETIPIYEVALKHKDEKTVPVELKVTSLIDDDGKTIGRIGLARDIRERKQAEAALRDSEEKYRAMTESMQEAVYICSSGFRVEYMNPAMIRRTGRDATGENCFKALHDFEDKCPWCMHYKTQQGEYFESEIVSPKDNRSYHVSCSPIVHGDGSISKMTVFRDTTDLKKLEAQLQQAQKMEAIGTLAGGIAHDFNNILGAIIGYAELAKMKTPQESNVSGDLDQVITSGNRAVDLVQQILTVSRRQKKERRPMQLKYIVKEALKMLKATLPSTIEIKDDSSKDAGVINADPTQMHQVIMNLCTNAGHAMQENGGVLEVGIGKVQVGKEDSGSGYLGLPSGSYLSLTVSDTGHGIPRHVMDKIFDPYFTTKDTGEGTGLGLSVAMGIVKAHGGTITVYSESEKGTTFHVYLPLILEEERREKESDEPPPTGSERILFIDDEQALVELGGQMLERLGYKVVTKQSSIEALELFRAEPDRFDLVITDMTMPHMTGDKLARELMKIRPQIPIILCTGHSKKISEDKAKGLGIRAFVMKPILKRILAETVRKALD